MRTGHFVSRPTHTDHAIQLRSFSCWVVVLSVGTLLLTACELPAPKENTPQKYKPATVKGAKSQHILSATSVPPSLPPGESPLPSISLPAILPSLSPEASDIPLKVKITAIKPLSVDASSELDDPRYGRFRASHVIDGNPHTCWQEFKDDAGEGEWIEIKLKKADKISKIGIVNGFAWPDHPKWGNVFAKNPRLKDVRLSFSDGSGQSISFADHYRPQVINIDEVLTSSVRLTIRSVYPGTEWKDTSLSEVTLYGAAYQVNTRPTPQKSPNTPKETSSPKPR